MFLVWGAMAPPCHFGHLHRAVFVASSGNTIFGRLSNSHGRSDATNGAPGLATRSKKLRRGLLASLLGTRTLLVTSASLLVTSALLVVTRSY